MKMQENSGEDSQEYFSQPQWIWIQLFVRNYQRVK